MLPTVNRNGSRNAPARSSSYMTHYLRRIIKWRQMDVEYTFWQMLHLCISPKIVYQNTKYHKQTKNQWARDDPAFIVILCYLLTVSSISFHTAYGKDPQDCILTILHVVFVDFLLIGLTFTTVFWFLVNRYLREDFDGITHAVEQRVEWLYAFDVHCNSFFPVFIILYVIQYFLSPLLLAHGFLPSLLSNVLFSFAFSYYYYITFLGYEVLPFLERTTVFLYPIGIILIAFPILAITKFNPTRFALGFYF